MTSADEAIAARTRRFREWAYLSQARAARELGISRQTLRRYESGDCRISASMVYAMSLLYGVSVLEFFPSPPPRRSASL